MSKIKVVQIAYMGDEGRTEYLDDQGRVWYDGGHTERYDETSSSYKSRWVTKWKLVDLPDEQTKCYCYGKMVASSCPTHRPKSEDSI